jgi:hypothetical protein
MYVQTPSKICITFLLKVLFHSIHTQHHQHLYSHQIPVKKKFLLLLSIIKIIMFKDTRTHHTIYTYIHTYICTRAQTHTNILSFSLSLSLSAFACDFKNFLKNVIFILTHSCIRNFLVILIKKKLSKSFQKVILIIILFT